MIWEARIVPRVGIVRRLWPTPGRTETGQIERALDRASLRQPPVPGARIMVTGALTRPVRNSNSFLLMRLRLSAISRSINTGFKPRDLLVSHSLG